MCFKPSKCPFLFTDDKRNPDDKLTQKQPKFGEVNATPDVSYNCSRVVLQLSRYRRAEVIKYRLTGITGRDSKAEDPGSDTLFTFLNLSI